MAEAQDKGNALESAVHAIESAILKSCPAYSDKTFHIENNKIIVTEGVHHEIDIWVTVELGSGYKAIFIFECKNTQDKVNKNDVIIFAEKIKAAGAQKGFLVARSFTSDAEAQAAKEPRIALFYVSQLPTADVPLPFGFHILNVEEIENVFVNIQVQDKAECSENTVIDLPEAFFAINGDRLDLAKYIGDWVNWESSQRCNRFRSESVLDGVCTLAFDAVREYSGIEVVVNGERIAKMVLSGKVRVRVGRGIVVSHFEVKSRGRAILVKADLPGIECKAIFAAICEENF